MYLVYQGNDLSLELNDYIQRVLFLSTDFTIQARVEQPSVDFKASAQTGCSYTQEYQLLLDYWVFRRPSKGRKEQDNMEEERGSRVSGNVFQISQRQILLDSEADFVFHGSFT